MNQDKLAKNQTDRSRSILIASGLILAIALLGFIQWATAFRGDLLWVIMSGLGILLMGTILGFLQNTAPTSEDTRQTKKQRSALDRQWLDELHRNDPYYLGSPYYRGHLDD
jgi:energy-converting hydrogenase Eha subunit G